MQGYFCYKLEGSKEELEQALEFIKKVANKEIEHKYLYASIAKDLFMFRQKIEENVAYDLQTKKEKEKNKNTHILRFDMLSSGNVSSLYIDFDRMPYLLSNTFVNLKISGEGYELDYMPKESFVSDRGSNQYEIVLVPECIYISKDDIDIENMEINIDCPSCEESISIHLRDNKTFEYETVCDCCEIPIICELEFDI